LGLLFVDFGNYQGNKGFGFLIKLWYFKKTFLYILVKNLKVDKGWLKRKLLKRKGLLKSLIC